MGIFKDFSFWAIVAYLLPGLLIVQARSLAARTVLAPVTKESLVNFVIWTVIYDLVLWSFGFALQTSNSISGLEVKLLLKLFVFVPTGIGFIFGLLERYSIIQRLLLPVGVNVPLPIKAVWLEIFSGIELGTYLIVVLKDGTIYNAVVTEDSRFSSNPDSPDLYLGQTYSLNDWEPSKPRRAVYISGGEIRSIEIISRQ